MSGVSYLFGNVDEEGKLEKNDLEKELRETLETVENSAEYLTKILSDAIDLGVDSIQQSKSDRQHQVKHQDDALDYSQENELAEDIELPKPPQIMIQNTNFDVVLNKNIEEKKTIKKLSDYFPNFVPGQRLKFSDLFASKVPKSYQILRLDPLKNNDVNDTSYQLQTNDVEIFFTLQPARFTEEKKEPVIVLEEEEIKEIEKPPDPINTASFDPVVLEAWEDKIVWDNDDLSGSAMPTFNKSTMFRNTHLEVDEWMDAIIWEEDEPHKKVEFHMDDPKLVVLQSEVEEIKNPKPDNRLSLYRKTPDGKIIDQFNLSDDWLYEVKQKHRRVRQTHGPASLVHSLPAIMLHTQYFKPLLHVKELRSHHRPSIKFPIKEWSGFSRVKAIKKKKLKEIDPAEVMKSPKDVSLKDTAKFVLVEYCEEYPPIIQNVGMASLIYNYYRKKDEKDTFVPKVFKSDYCLRMEVQSVDASPFFGYGDVKPGQSMQVLYNNLFRAPLFEQRRVETDFLVVRNTYHGVTKYFIREIPNHYIAGQSYPVQEVPRPQARKITQSLKMRLQIVAYRLMRQDPYKRLRYDKLKRMFPMFNDMQIRQKLKEFAQYLKKGENTGWWKLKPNTTLPDEEGIRKIITPENVCLVQSSLVGQQRLKDAGYAAEDFKENENEEDESHMDIEVQLAPWTTTKNFVVAASGKGMVRLFGPGDPTGCGEGFSFIRASMKEMFFKYGETQEKQRKFIEEKTKTTYHKYSIAEQQIVYKSEIERIWTNQLRSLSAATARPDEKEKELDKLRQTKQQLEMDEEKDRQVRFGADTEIPAPKSPPAVDKEDNAPSDDESQHESTLANKNKMLVINRLVKNAKGELEWVSEVITDLKIINAYVRYRKIIEEPSEEEAEMEQTPENKKAMMIRRTKANIVKLQLKQGKKPTLEDSEEYADLSYLHVETKPLPVVLKIPSIANQPPAPAPSSSRKRKTQDNFDDYPLLDQAKFSNRRRNSPLVELANIFETIITELILIPEAWAFLHPVSQHAFPDYHTIIKNPMEFETIRDNVRNYRYPTKDKFFQDVELVAENCKTYNGVAHPLTSLAKSYVKRVEDYLIKNAVEIEKLELEIKEEGNKKAAALKDGAPQNDAENAQNPNQNSEIEIKSEQIDQNNNGVVEIDQPKNDAIEIDKNNNSAIEIDQPKNDAIEIVQTNNSSVENQNQTLNAGNEAPSVKEEQQVAMEVDK